MKFTDLKHIKLFSDLPEEEIICDVFGEKKTYKKGEFLFKEGDEAKFFYIFLSGKIEVYRILKAEKLFLNYFLPGETGGELPLLTSKQHLANGEAIEDSDVYLIGEKYFWRILGDHPSIRKKILNDIDTRLSEYQTLSTQREKLISLGTMAAGLAHELNNPAAAAARSSITLIETLNKFNSLSSAIVGAVFFGHVKEGQYPFQELQDAIHSDTQNLDVLERNDREEGMAHWLEELKIEDAWEIAPILVGASLESAFLKQFAAKVLPERVIDFLSWLSLDIELRNLSSELRLSTQRISELVGAVKSYSYMDQGIQLTQVDLNKGLDDTLLMLNFKIKKKNAEIKKEYSGPIEVSAFGSELNQVWTNLLDNSLDALPESGGLITVRSKIDTNDTNMATVEIEDNGSGINEESKQRIFDPFYTTKDVGKGTGIGLEVSLRIIAEHHKGTLRLVESKSGKTLFRICIPISAK